MYCEQAPVQSAALSKCMPRLTTTCDGLKDNLSCTLCDSGPKHRPAWWNRLYAHTRCIVQLSPGWLTTFLLALLMTFMTWKLAHRGIATWKAETKQHHQEDVSPVEPSVGDDAAPADLSQPLLSPGPGELPPTPPPGEHCEC